MVRRRVGLVLLAVAGVVLVSLAALHNPLQPRSRPAASVEQIIDPAAFRLGGLSADGGKHEGLRIRLVELDVDLPIVEGDGYNAPLYQAAHYPGLGWPGEGARSVIYAHARPGMFGPLAQGKVGQHVEISAPGKRPMRYTLTQFTGRWPITDTSVLKPLPQEQLVLVTCTTYNYNDPRIVAIAEPQ